MSSTVNTRQSPPLEPAGALADFDPATLAQADDVAYVVSADLRLTYLNPAWFRFAHDNGGDSVLERFGVGACVIDGISGPLRDFYADAYARILAGASLWAHDYECSNPDVYRVFHQTAYPLRDGSGLVVTNSLAVLGPMPAEHRLAMPATPSAYCDANGFITQCSHCRRAQRADGSARWDWVPAWVERMPRNISHSLCGFCYDYYYIHARPSLSRQPVR